MKLLVAYASKYGSTAEIAEIIGKELHKRNHTVDVKSVETVANLAGYDGFIIGSALYAGSWLNPASEFLHTHQDVLAEKPVWFFSSGPTGTGDPNELMDGWTFPENLKDVREKINPLDIIAFHGKIDLDKLSSGERMIIKSVKAVVGDYRDWLVIRGWAGKIDLDSRGR